MDLGLLIIYSYKMLALTYYLCAEYFLALGAIFIAYYIWIISLFVQFSFLASRESC